MKLVWIVLLLLLTLATFLGYYYKKLTSHRVTGNLIPSGKSQLVVFDFDGTLADSYEELIKSYNSIAPEYGTQKIDDEYAQELKDQSPQEILAHLGINRIKLPFLARKLNRVFAEKIDTIKPFNGITTALQKLSKDYHIGILTSNSRENVEHFLSKHNLKEYIQFIVSDVGAFGKTKALQHMIELSRQTPDKSIYIGDELRDGRAAQNVGIPFGAVTYGVNSSRILKTVNSVFMINSPDQLEPQLNNYWQSLDR